jgi:hypothetical protein
VVVLLVWRCHSNRDEAVSGRVIGGCLLSSRLVSKHGALGCQLTARRGVRPCLTGLLLPLDIVQGRRFRGHREGTLQTILARYSYRRIDKNAGAAAPGNLTASTGGDGR